MPAFMNDNEQRQAHNQLEGTNQKCFHVYYITIYILRITIYFLLSTRMNSFFGGGTKDFADPPVRKQFAALPHR